MGSPKAKVCLEDGSQVTVLLDTRTEINIMTKKLIEEANLTMRKRPKLELVSYTGHSWLFLRLCKNIEITLGELKTKHPIFVIEAGDHNLILGQLFLNSVKFSQKYKPDRMFNIITYLYMHQIVVFRILAF